MVLTKTRMICIAALAATISVFGPASVKAAGSGPVSRLRPAIVLTRRAPHCAGRMQRHVALRAADAAPPLTSATDAAAQEKYRPAVLLQARDQYEKERGFRFNKIVRGNTGKKLLALTFDDGPHEGYT